MNQFQWKLRINNNDTEHLLILGEVTVNYMKCPETELSFSPQLS